MIRVQVKPAVWRWALERAGSRAEILRNRFPRLASWQRGESEPTLKQLEAFANAAHVPFGYLLLPEPPEEELPIPDLRTLGGRGVQRPSPDLLDVVYLCQRRQAWYQDYADAIGEDPRAFIGSARLTTLPDRVATEMRQRLGFTLEQRRQCATWTDALRLFIEQAEEVGILVMVSGIVGSNTHRILDPEEFRGFAMADRLAPLVFINGADTKAAHMFTLAHELAHLWLGQSALSNAAPNRLPADKIETWCNRVAAELLVPLPDLNRELGHTDPLNCVGQLARTFKVSTLVVLRRILDSGKISRERFQKAYAAEVTRLTERSRAGGGDFYLTQPARLSRRFARALITSTLEGQTLFRDAFHMLGISKEQTFRELGRTLEVLP
jgi:Zn-dependent peptidase ImmA (M78 family)/transcriptional regulator with XRE-family HTH domain